eukprot:CAMPEP_0168516612 /NCGR_PEP_ID=MMETSP0405-20121227/5507_1 /TAXON_ID=498012 /ORGANISM="Trichosphaerium sp, Strain Am-I-7 wt" /LENGTH=672 /DNA_ID=CAMNT_0008536359 /DNA_START=345 /DNA_END=2360 /DNA_ORIENTATION=-
MSKRSASSCVNFNFIFGSVISEPGNADWLQTIQLAGDIWSSVLQNDITVDFAFEIGTLNGGTIASASTGLSATVNNAGAILAALNDNYPGTYPSTVLGMNSNFPTGFSYQQEVIFFTEANGKALIDGFSLAADDTSIIFNSAFNFDVDLTDGLDNGKTNLLGVVLHEMGHALGYVSQVEKIDFEMNRNNPVTIIMAVQDMFRVDATSSGDTFELADRQYTPGQTAFFYAPDGLTTSTFSTGTTQGDGRQAPHWKDSLNIGIMDPTFAVGEISGISEADLTGMRAFGYNVNMSSVKPFIVHLSATSGTGGDVFTILGFFFYGTVMCNFGQAGMTAAVKLPNHGEIRCTVPSSSYSTTTMTVIGNAESDPVDFALTADILTPPPTTLPPTTLPPTTLPPTTLPPTTLPPTTLPPTTLPPTTLPPTTLPPTTLPPTTLPPTTLPPTTLPPTTLPPTTLPPTTLPPTTLPPTTLPPTTLPPTTLPPTTLPPTTLPPTTLPPTTLPPTTLPPTTLPPTTLPPTTLPPTTLPPTTLPPTTLPPTTLPPTTLPPTTLPPTTLPPSTQPPTTVPPTTPPPMTVAPTTMPPTRGPTAPTAPVIPTTVAPTTLPPTQPTAPIVPTQAPTATPTAPIAPTTVSPTSVISTEPGQPIAPTDSPKQTSAGVSLHSIVTCFLVLFA